MGVRMSVSKKFKVFQAYGVSKHLEGYSKLLRALTSLEFGFEFWKCLKSWKAWILTDLNVNATIQKNGSGEAGYLEKFLLFY